MSYQITIYRPHRSLTLLGHRICSGPSRRARCGCPIPEKELWLMRSRRTCVRFGRTDSGKKAACVDVRTCMAAWRIERRRSARSCAPNAFRTSASRCASASSFRAYHQARRSRARAQRLPQRIPWTSDSACILGRFRRHGISRRRSFQPDWQAPVRRRDTRRIVPSGRRPSTSAGPLRSQP